MQEYDLQNLSSITEKMKDQRIANYVIAGLDSYLLSKGKVRLFKNNRNHLDYITPHSHRYDFTCLVLEGRVVNQVWIESEDNNSDLFQVSKIIQATGKFGGFSKITDRQNLFRAYPQIYSAGETYEMTSHQIHSIRFDKGTKVLFFEGPEVADHSFVLEPVVDDKVIPTFKTEDYMFIREGK